MGNVASKKKKLYSYPYVVSGASERVLDYDALPSFMVNVLEEQKELLAAQQQLWDTSKSFDVCFLPSEAAKLTP